MFPCVDNSSVRCLLRHLSRGSNVIESETTRAGYTASGRKADVRHTEYNQEDQDNIVLD
jgi:hypothetical protein